MVRMLHSLLAIALLAGAASAQDAPPSKGQQAAAPVINAIQKALAAEAALPPAGSVRERLERMGVLDQAGRAHIDEIDWANLTPEDGAEARNAIAAAIEPVDQANAAELLKLLPHDGWFGLAEYGARASDAAFHILQHSDEKETKERLLLLMQDMALRGDIDGSNFAAMFDRMATSEGRPQRYGTQFRCVAGKLQSYPLEDPDNVERLRAAFKLGQTFAESQQMHLNRPCR